METSARLRAIANSLNDENLQLPECALLEQYAHEYENRSDAWRRLITLQSMVLMLVQSYDAANLDEKLVKRAQKNDLIDSELVVETPEMGVLKNPCADEEMAEQMDETKKLLEECPLFWQSITEQKANLRSVIHGLIDFELKEIEAVNENKDDGDWAEICELMKNQRTRLREEIDESKARLSQYESETARPLLKELKQTIAELKDLKAAKNEIITMRQQTEVLLEETHGIIVACDDETPMDVNEMLVDEEETMTQFYMAKLKRNGRIFNINSRGVDETKIELIVTPKSGWMLDRRPTLKQVRIVYDRKSLLPADITVKLDTKDVDSEHFDDILDPIIEHVQNWKSRMLKSTNIDLFALVVVFMK